MTGTRAIREQRGRAAVRDYGSHWTQGFPPHVLRDYALIADGERGGLVGPRGDIVWMCAPRWHSDAVFASLIGGGGIYAVTPASSFVWGGYYEEGSLIWRSRWITPESIIECREALAFPGATDRVVVLRQIIAREAAAKVERHPRSAGRVRPARPAIGQPRGRRSLDRPDRRAVPALVRGRGAGQGPPGRPGVAAGDEPDRAAGRKPGPRSGNFPAAVAGQAAGRRPAVARDPRRVGNRPSRRSTA